MVVPPKPPPTDASLSDTQSDTEQEPDTVTEGQQLEHVPKAAPANNDPSPASIADNGVSASTPAYRALRASLTAEKKVSANLQRTLTLVKKKLQRLQDTTDDRLLALTKKASHAKNKTAEVQAAAKIEKSQILETHNIAESSLKSQIASSAAEVKELRSKVKQLKAELKRTKKDLDAALLAAKGHQGKVSGLRETIAESLRARDELKKQCRALEAAAVKAQKLVDSNLVKKFEHEEKLASTKLEREKTQLQRQREALDAAESKRRSIAEEKKDYAAFTASVRLDAKKNGYELREKERQAKLDKNQERVDISLGARGAYTRSNMVNGGQFPNPASTTLAEVSHSSFGLLI